MTINIRCSMLPAYFDCGRRAASRQFGEIIQAAGFTLRETSPSVGSSFGTAAHGGLEYMLRYKIAHFVVGDQASALEIAMEKLKEEAKGGLEWDDTTPSIQAAQFQMRRVIAEAYDYAQTITPKAVELEVEADAGDGFAITGHIDILDAGVRDFKSGALHRPYQSQLGGYSLLAKANGHAVGYGAIDWIPRAPVTNPQPPVETESYPLDTCERAAWSTIQRIKRDVIAFQQTGDPFEFPANPMTMMCSERFCSAHGTSFCAMHLKSKEKK